MKDETLHYSNGCLADNYCPQCGKELTSGAQFKELKDGVYVCKDCFDVATELLREKEGEK